MAKVGEVIDGLWRFEATHPEWTEAEGGEEGWEQTVAWWAVRTIAGLVLIDPLVEDWPDLDELVTSRGRCAAVVRTCHWHERSVAEAAARYDAPVIDQTSGEAPAGWRAVDVERNDEIALWLPDQRALLFGDAMLRESGSGRLRMCPPSWTQPPGGRERLRELLAALLELPVEHVLVSHGPFVLGDGAEALRAAISA